MKVGVFDSGIGGLSVAKHLEAAFPQHEVVYVNDKQHVPYGTRSIEEIHGFTLPILEKLVQDGCGIIVIACNTVTTCLISRLRQQLPVPLIGIEPMVKPASALTKTGKIIVCATPRTLESDRYAFLKQQYASNIEVYEPDCSDWPQLIENSSIHEAIIAERIEPGLSAGADVIVLGCTHYHWIESQVNHLAAGRATVLQPESAIAAELERRIEALAA